MGDITWLELRILQMAQVRPLQVRLRMEGSPDSDLMIALNHSDMKLLFDRKLAC